MSPSSVELSLVLLFYLARALLRFFSFPVFALFPRFLAISPLKESLRRREVVSFPLTLTNILPCLLLIPAHLLMILCALFIAKYYAMCQIVISLGLFPHLAILLITFAPLYSPPPNPKQIQKRKEREQGMLEVYMSEFIS